jgi:hypothetical protein
MRTIRFATQVSLGLLLLTACARLASAQTYIWTDERGVVHAAADPSEVPAKQREKAVHDAAARPDKVTIAPADPDNANVPAAPAPASSRKHTGGHGVDLDADPEVTPAANDDDASTPKAKRLDPNKLPPPDPGFEWHCATDPEGGPPKCEQFEKKSNRLNRRADARRAAREKLGVTDPTQEFDPDVRKRVDQQADEEFKKSTPVPKTKGSTGPDDDDSESSDDSQD